MQTLKIKIGNREFAPRVETVLTPAPTADRREKERAAEARQGETPRTPRRVSH